ncbi:MAG: endonuclease NucS domain-containing protein [Pseudomonadota bacterium]
MAIYDKPTKTLMLEFVAKNLKPGQVFDKKQAVDWFSTHYPDIRPATVQMHVEGMAINSTVRKHHPSIKPGSGHDLFYKVAPGKFRLWEKNTDSEPLYLDKSKTSMAGESVDSEIARDVEEVSEGSEEFAFERDLRNYLSKNLTSIEQGLKVYQDEEFSGVEFPVGGRFIDILAVDTNGDYVVVELKVSRGHERVIGQILRYMAWVKKHIAAGKNVRGIIVANEVSEDLQLAASLVPGLELFEYAISMKLTPVRE